MSKQLDTIVVTIKPHLKQTHWLALNLVNVTEAWHHPAKHEIGLNITLAVLDSSREILYFSLRSGSTLQKISHENLRSIELEKNYPNIKKAAHAWYRFKSILSVADFQHPTLIAHFSDESCSEVAVLESTGKSHQTAIWKTRSVHDLILIHGMHRSGTSATAQALILSGCKLPGKPLEPNRWNPDGYFEPIELVRIHDDTLRRLGRSWFDPQPLPSEWVTSPIYSNLVKDISKYLSTYARFNTKATLIKDPRISLFHQAWKEALDNLDTRVRHIVIVRPVEEVAASLYVRDRLPAPISSLLWFSTNLSLCQWLNRKQHVLINYKDLTSTPKETLTTLEKILDCPQIKITKNAIESINPKLNHFHQVPSEIPDAVQKFSHELNHSKSLPSPENAVLSALSESESKISVWYSHWREIFQEYHQLLGRVQSATKLLNS